jgi:catechol 2,3-dioxygenase-like lactoylglutathione lyase family enzyme
VEVRNIRWVGVPAQDYDGMVAFVRDVLGLRVNFEDRTTAEFSTLEGDEFQIMAPGDPYYELFTQHASGPVPLFEVDDVHLARGELEEAGIEVLGDTGRDSRWEWIHFRAPDGHLYELASRLNPGETNRP